jgi:GNAT superfamily N-acetyltransferase
MRVTPHLLLPATVTFVARAGDAVVGTVSLFLDSVLGLPAEALLRRELGQLRARRRRVAEAGALAVAPGRRGYGVTYLLLKALYRCAVELLGVDDLVLAVHPDDEDYFRAALSCARLHSPGPAPGRGARAPAVPLHLDLRAARWTWFQTAGHLPPTAANPYHMFIQRHDPQITLPDSIGVACHERREALADLLEVEPRLLDALPARLRAIVTDLVGPAASLLDARVWEPVGSWGRAAAAPCPLR